MIPSRPTDDNDKEAWRAYWIAQGQEWRTEPEIDNDRQKYLTERCNIKPDIEGIYPFQGIELSRADIEWLIQIYKNRHNSEDWSDESQQVYKRLDLRGADLHHANLKNLKLKEAKLSGTNLKGAHLEGAIFKNAYLGEEKGPPLPPANLQDAFFDPSTELDGIYLADENKMGPYLSGVRWGGANLGRVKWSQVDKLADENMALQMIEFDEKGKEREKDRYNQIKDHEKALQAYHLLAATLQDQGLTYESARFGYRARIMQRRLNRLELLHHLEDFLKHPKLISFFLHKPNRFWARLIIFVPAFFTGFLLIFLPLTLSTSASDPIIIIIFRQFAVPLSLVTATSFLFTLLAFKPMVRLTLFFLFLGCLLLIFLLLTSLLVVIILRQPLPELIAIISILIGVVASVVAFIVPLLQSASLRRTTKKFGQQIISPFLMFVRVVRDYLRYAFSLFLDILAGYGYRPGITLIWYLVVIIGFASYYYVIGHDSHQLSYWGALVLSLTSFHGRGFFPGPNFTNLDDPLVRLAAFEAVIGLIIEISFIATFTQRYFGK